MRQVRHDAARGERVEIPDRLELHAAAEALVGERRIGIAVGDDDGAARQRRADDLRDVLLARRHEEEGLRQRRRRRVVLLEESADGRAERRAVGLAGQDHLEPAGAEPLPQALAMSGLARAFDALNGDEEPAHGRNSNTLKNRASRWIMRPR